MVLPGNGTGSVFCRRFIYCSFLRTRNSLIRIGWVFQGIQDVFRQNGRWGLFAETLCVGHVEQVFRFTSLTFPFFALLRTGCKLGSNRTEILPRNLPTEDCFFFLKKRKKGVWWFGWYDNWQGAPAPHTVKKTNRRVGWSEINPVLKSVSATQGPKMPKIPIHL